MIRLAVIDIRVLQITAYSKAKQRFLFHLVPWKKTKIKNQPNPNFFLLLFFRYWCQNAGSRRAKKNRMEKAKPSLKKYAQEGLGRR